MHSTVPADSSGKLIAVTSSTRSTPGPGRMSQPTYFLPAKQLAKVGVTLLALDLVRAELEDRVRAVERLGHQAAKRLVVVCASPGLLLEPGWDGVRKGRRANVRRPDRPLQPIGLGRIIDPGGETVKANASRQMQSAAGRSTPSQRGVRNRFGVDAQLAELGGKLFGAAPLLVGSSDVLVGSVVPLVGSESLLLGAFFAEWAGDCLRCRTSEARVPSRSRRTHARRPARLPSGSIG